jgi:hypothetical protein
LLFGYLVSQVTKIESRASDNSLRKETKSMKVGLNPGWVQEGRYTNSINGYTVYAYKYRRDGEVGWQASSWSERGSMHEFWVSEGKFYRAKIQPPEVPASCQTIEFFGEIESIDSEERGAILDAIEAGEKQFTETLVKVSLPDLEQAIVDRSFVGSAICEKAYHVAHAWINDQHSSTNHDPLYKKVQVLLVEYAKLRDRD